MRESDWMWVVGLKMGARLIIIGLLVWLIKGVTETVDQLKMIVDLLQ